MVDGIILLNLGRIATKIIIGLVTEKDDFWLMLQAT